MAGRHIHLLDWFAIIVVDHAATDCRKNSKDITVVSVSLS